MALNRIIPTAPPGWACKDSVTVGMAGKTAQFSGQAADLKAWENLMSEALIEAGKAARLGEVPVGAVVVDMDGTIIGRGHNRPVSGHNPVAHAEIEAICMAAAHKQNYRLNGAVLIVTLEPCLMCAGAIVHARLAGVVYGAKDPKAGALESRLDSLELDFHNHRAWQMGGILKNECTALLDEFFKERR